MKNFDQFVGIDWSGAKAPINTKSIAVASLLADQKSVQMHPELRSRSAVFDYISGLVRAGTRTLIGIDCNFGYAQEIGERQFGPDYMYADLWDAVERCNSDHDNFFAGGYWQAAAHKKYFWIEGKMREGFKMPKRLTEIQCAADGYGTPESPFKLIGAKQVGKGGLSGMRMARALKKAFGEEICIWPFEENTDQARIVMTEIYPRQFLMRTGHGHTKIRSFEDLELSLQALGQAQYEGQNFTDHDADAIVSAAGLRFLCGADTTIPEYIAHPPMLDRQRAAREGWIFGVGDQ